MENSLRERYKVQKSNTEKSYDYHLSLKSNKEYEERVDKAFLAIVNLFACTYPNVKIEQPQGREKTRRSMRTKIENLEIERLCKLFAIEGITKEEQKELVTLIEKRIKGNAQQIEEISNGKIEDLEIIHKLMEEEEIDDNIKTALIRIIKTRIEREEVPNKQELLEEIEETYGQTAAQKAKQAKRNILHWECIEMCKQDQESLEKLHNSFEYLRIKDLRGFEIIIDSVPDEIETENEMLKQLIEKRKQVSEKEKAKYNDLCCIVVANEFAQRLMANKEFLESLNIQVLPEGYKHKKKENGYIADHIKFCYKDHPEYTFELQLRSIYRENLTKANGVAAHDKRSGKRRIFPSVENKGIFMEQSQEMIPKYTTIRRKESNNRQYSIIHKCQMAENMLEYYIGYVPIDSQIYQKAMQYIKEEQAVNQK